MRTQSEKNLGKLLKIIYIDRINITLMFKLQIASEMKQF